LNALAAHGDTLKSLTISGGHSWNAEDMAAMLARLPALKWLDIDDSRMRALKETFPNVEIHVEEMRLASWDLLAAARFPRLKRLEMLKDKTRGDAAAYGVGIDAGIAVKLADQWASSMPVLSDVRLRYWHPALEELLLVERSPNLKTIEMCWSPGDGISSRTITAVGRILRKVEAAILIEPPGWDEGNPVWQAIAESRSLERLEIHTNSFEKLLRAVSENRSLRTLRMYTLTVMGPYATEIIRKLILQSAITDFGFAGANLTFLKGVPEERLGTIRLAEGEFMPLDAEELELLFKTLPAPRLHIGGSLGQECTEQGLDRMATVLAVGLARWNSLKEFKLDLDVSTAQHAGSYWVPQEVVDVIKKMTSLESLELPHLTAAHWQGEINLPRLTELKLKVIEERAAFRTVLGQLPALRKLDAGYVPKEALDLEVVTRLTELVEFRVRFDGEVGPVLAELLKMQSLQRVYFWSEDGSFRLPELEREQMKAPLVVVSIGVPGFDDPLDAIRLKTLIPTLRVLPLRVVDSPEVLEFIARHPEVDWGRPISFRTRDHEDE
jgi:hypothetical protein